MKHRLVLIGSLVLLLVAIILGVSTFSVSEVGTQINLYFRIGFFCTLALVIPFAMAGLLLDETSGTEE